MIRLVQFLNEKNHFLEKFYSLNEKQISLLESGQIDDIEKFYNQREDLLKILKYIDAEIYKAHASYRAMNKAINRTIGVSDTENSTEGGAQNNTTHSTYTEDEKAEIRACLRTKEIYVKNILDQDLVILSLIDEAKSRIIKELQDVQRARKALAGYKSPAA